MFGISMILVLNCFVLVELTAITKPSMKLLVDHDGGADDAMALFIALLYEKYFNGPKIVGITTTHGNVDEPQSFINTQIVLSIAERSDVPIYRGCNTSLIYTPPSDLFFGRDGLGDLDNVTYSPIEAQPQHASLAMIELSKIYKGDLVILTLGALTNIALAMKLDPLFLSRTSQLYTAAGKIYSKEDPDPEYNAAADVEAYDIVLQNATPDKVTIISTSQVRNSNISKTWREDVLGAIPTRIMQTQNSFERISRQNQSSCRFLDPLAMAFVLNSSLVEEYKFSKNGIILCGDDRGINTNDFEADPNVRLMYSSIEPYKQFLLQVFSADCAPGQWRIPPATTVKYSRTSIIRTPASPNDPLPLRNHRFSQSLSVAVSRSAF